MVGFILGEEPVRLSPVAGSVGFEDEVAQILHRGRTQPFVIDGDTAAVETQHRLVGIRRP